MKHHFVFHSRLGHFIEPQFSKSKQIVLNFSVTLMLLSLCPESFGIFQSRITLFKLLLKTLVKSRLECWVVSLNVIPH